MDTVRRRNCSFRPRFQAKAIRYWAGEYEIKEEEDRIERILAPTIRQRGYIVPSEFLELCKWKTPRTFHLCEQNSQSYLRAVTGTSISTSDEQLKIEVLTLLSGVGWPTASSILHLLFPNKYPILDFRALWSLQCKVPKQYTFEFWQRYTEYCVGLAGQAHVSMRDLDRALWQYSKENQ